LNSQPNLGLEDEDFPGMESFYRFIQRYVARMESPLTDEDSAQEREARRLYKINSAYLDINEFFLVLAEFVSGGRYAKILNSPRDKDLSDYRLICFDLKKIKADPTLYPLVGMLITELALDLTRKFPDDIKYIALDEAWALLAGTLEEFIVTMFRTVRKNKGCITIITQGINELINSPIGFVLIENAENKIILRHKNESALMRLQVPLAFTDHEIDQIRSLKLRKSKTSRDIFIKQGSVAKVYAVEAPPEINPILTSRASEKSEFDKLVRFFQNSRQVEVRDERGNLVRDEQGMPVYENVLIPSLAAAAAQFAENRLIKTPKKRAGGRPAA
jgi:type IV secretory pathway VirB4 component